MHVDTAISHPTQRQLVEFAESLVDRHAPVSALMAAHVAGCTLCAREVKQIRASLELASLARLPEPSNELTKRIVMQAQQMRVSAPPTPAPGKAAFIRTLQMAACMVGALALAYISFGAALRDLSPGDRKPSFHASFDPDASPVFHEALQEKSNTVKALSSAISLQPDKPDSPYEQGHRRFLHALDDDMSAARAALERNPGCPRANQVMLTSVNRQLEGLRNLYLDRKL
jgi:hypothetical protein